MAEEKEYRRLPGRGTRGPRLVIVSRSRLWLGRDHLLAVETSFRFIETYKRFYFRDIQGFVIRKTAGGKIGNIVVGVMALLPLLVAFGAAVAQPSDFVVAMVFGSVSAIFLLILIVNMILGPTCACHIKTAVQFEELPTLGRLKRAHKVLRRIRPLIVEAQGEFPVAQPVVETAEPASPAGQDADPFQPPAGT